MKNNEVYQALFDLEKDGVYTVSENVVWSNKLDIDITLENEGKRYINLRVNGKTKKCYLEKYIKFKTGYYSKDKIKADKISFSADFETITEYKYSMEERRSGKLSKKEMNEKIARIWAYGLVNIYDTNKLNYGTSLQEFMELVKSFKNADIFFHNLKFDGSYILNYFHSQNIDYVPERNQLQPNTYTCHIANGQYYSITWCISNSKGHKQHLITFKDSYKIMPASIKDLGKSFAKELNGKGKVEVDKEFYTRKRGLDHQLTEEEIEYLKQDCLVMSEALKFMFELGHVKGTIGSNALDDFETRFNKDDQYNYKNHFPILPMGDYIEEDGNRVIDDKGNGWNSWIIKAYRGGYTFVAKQFRNIPVGKGIVLDVNSLYPYVMLSKLLPYSEPVWFNGNYADCKAYEKRIYPLFIQKIQVEFVVKENHLPTIPDKSKGRKFADYLESSNGKPIELYLTNIDLKLFLEHYDFENIKFIGGYMFKGKHDIFKNYIDHWKEQKIQAEKNKNKALRYISKLFLNSLYGKFASRWDKPASNPDFTSDKLKFKKKLKWDELTKEQQEESYQRQVKYPAMAVFITSYARQITIEAAQKNYDAFRYCDTDSLHLETLDFPTNIPIDHDKTGELGLWKHEGTFKRAKFIRSKTYVEDTFGKMEFDEKEGKEVFEECNPEESTCTQLKVTVSGMSKGCHKYVTFENFNEHDEKMYMPACDGMYFGNLRPEIVNGGTDIKEGYYLIVKNPTA
jgi:hypothetical protein